ncbi:MAG TPA: PqqD family protein [Aeromicrobium sp.]|nr:PqqD family protein [Aeromicrobium sp.]
MEAKPSAWAHDEALRLTVPISRVAADNVEGEAVIVNLDTGAYYTTEGAGCDAWQLLATGRTLGEVITLLGDRYAAADGEIQEYLQLLITTFLAEGLMVVLDPDDPAPGDDGTEGAGELPPLEPRPSFEPADLVSYSDMKGLLLLDPVHEVDARGWPHAAAGG